MSAAPSVRLEAVRRWYDEAGGAVVRAVDGVTLALHPGTLTVLLGPSGSGKTTLLSLAAGLLAPTSGTVIVAGVALAQLPQPALTAFRLRHVGIVFQAFHLVDALRAWENVELPMALAGVRRPGTEERALALLERVGLAHRRDAWPRALSGGEKQRCAIARALANDPSLLLADEPTGSLDGRAGAAVIALLRAEAVERGRTVLVASHDPRLARVADVVVAMADGRIADSPAGLSASGPGTDGWMDAVE